MVFADANEQRNPPRALWQEAHRSVAPYPEGVCQVPEEIPGTAFFPAGLGLLIKENAPRNAFPDDAVMIVGQDFNTLATFKTVLSLGSEEKSSPTWRNLAAILVTAGVPLERCFFTNVYMGLRDGGRETGRFSGARDRAFVSRCVDFFRRQLEVVRPRLILTLGLEPMRVLAANIFAIDPPATMSECCGIYRSVLLPHGMTTVVALTHPSFYNANVRRREYGALNGKAAEQAMIKDGWRAAFPTENGAGNAD